MKTRSIHMPETLRHLYLVISGRCNVLWDNSMTVSLAHTLSPGECFGVVCCAQNIPCYCTLRAAEKSKLLRLDYALLTQDPMINTVLLHNLLAITSSRIVTLSEKIGHTQSRSVRVKLSIFLHDRYLRCGSPLFSLGMSRNELAEYLNVTYPAMLRELSQMQKDNLLKLEGDRVELLNPEDLIEQGLE